MFEITQVGGAIGGECFLLKSDEKTALIDSGFAFSAQTLIDNLKASLNGRSLDYILLTHSHYDHISGTPYVIDQWPDAIVAASPYAKKVLQRETAQRILKEMNQHAAESFGVSHYPTSCGQLRIDIALEEGNILDLGNMTLEVLETPGHTRCSIGFFSKETRLLVANETFGTLGCGPSDVIPCHLIGHQATLDSIKKAAALNAEHLLVAHYGLLHGKECSSYFDAAARKVEQTMELVVQGYKNGLDLDGLIALLQNTYYSEALAAYQPEEAFLLNAKYMASMILKEVLGVEIR